jgi:hypothetical protein
MVGDVLGDTANGVLSPRLDDLKPLVAKYIQRRL